jgi:adenylate cyclase
VFWQDPARGKRRVLRGMIGSGVLFVVVLVGAAALSVSVFIRYRWVFLPVELMVAWTGQAACGIGYTGVQLRRQNRRIERMFGSAVGDQLLEYINAHPEIMTRNRRCQATVLFGDVRGFTALTEKLGSDQVVELLRQHFEALWKPLAEEGAWVDKYVGDMVMAAWNVLQPVRDHALQAVRAAVKMKIARHRLNDERARRGQPAVDFGVGVHTGPVVGGNIGSRKRSNFTLVGDTVNLASRIEQQANHAELLISERTYQFVKDHVVARARPPITIKGIRGEHVLYEVLALADGQAVPGKEQDAAQARPGDE